MMPDATSRPPRLTNRLIQVGALIANGATNQQIAHQLRLSKQTVDDHVARLMAATGTGSRTEAAVHMIERGILPTPTGRTLVRVDHLQVLMAALRKVESDYPDLASLASRFEAVYPAALATGARHGATLEKPSCQRPDSEDTA